jgi:hypothetical protein
MDGDDRGTKGDDWRYWTAKGFRTGPGMGCGFTSLLVVFVLAVLGVVRGAWVAALLVGTYLASMAVEVTWRWLSRDDPR